MRTSQNMKNITIPQNSLNYILFQRTGYLKNYFIFRLLTRIGCINPFYKLSVNLKSLFFASQIKREFNKDLVEEYSIIKQFLPQNMSSFLDIGCGVAGIDLLISHHYANNVDIFLIDKTQVDKNIHYYFETEGSFYNSLQISKKLLETNGVSSDRIHLQEATNDNKILFENEFDLIVSLISWGFHYPVSTYLNEVYDKLKPGGILIVDIRKDTDGKNEITSKFGNCRVIFESEKYIKILSRK